MSDQIKKYVDLLERALGNDEAFQKVYEALTTDKSVKADEAKQISKLFAGKGGRTKSESLGHIHRRHASLGNSKFKFAAIGGRLAG